MDGLGLGHGLRVDGMPVLFKIVTFPAEKTIKIQSNLWPVSERTKKPFLASRRSHLLNYSESHYKVYETLFCIEHAILNPPADLYQRITNPQLRFAHIAIYVGLKFFRDELVDWVEEAILQELAPLLTSPAVHIEQAALARQTHLGNWKSSETPFASTNPSLSHLILALATEDDDITAGLPRQRQISVADFSDLILTNVLNHPPSPRPPFPHHGSSHLVMHHALAVANRYWKNANGVKSILMRILPHLHINFVPGQRQVNHRPRLSCEAWINLGAPVLASDIISPTLLTQSQTEVVEASAAARDYIAQDINSTYELGSLKWAEVGRLLDKNSLPSEWDASSGDTQGGYVRETYDFVQEVFSGTDAIHKLAVIAAFISIKMIPRMFSECSKATIKALPTDPTAITNFMRALPWVTLEGRRGVRVPEPFISGWIAFIIGIYTAESPLRKHIRDHQGALGSAWTDKHGQKGMGLFNLIRMSLASSKNKRPFQGGRFPDVELLTPEAAQSLLDPVYGPYDALSLLVGRATAHQIAIAGECRYRPLVGTGKKRQAADQLDE
ncbi:hypothetical protein BDN72DRAFT_860671 [Pluteus cervinus]|uniref:Uncharacterized protein n=1 Tax=Pluteus cervinus TaxID=181527 RepID=A0ACD3AHW6_9AGAR|nr:hypothetical protein BDN72DRAFT_860671 [Pluteus cervinus]